MKWVTVSEKPAKPGECPVWDDHEERLFWTDIEAVCIFARYSDGSIEAWQMPERVGSFGLTTDPTRLVVALASGFALFNLVATDKTERIPMHDRLPKETRFNDGKCDPWGNFWAGTMSEATPRRPDGALYRLTPGLSVTCMRQEITMSNSLAWSPSGDRIHFADSPKQSIIEGIALPDIGHVRDQDILRLARQSWGAGWFGNRHQRKSVDRCTGWLENCLS